MTGIEAVRTALQGTQHVLGMYLSDLSDADLLLRPVPGANHTAWQLGHLIFAEQYLLGILPGAKYPPLPAGFAELHAKEGAGKDADAGFLTKAQYVELFNQMRSTTLAILDRMTDADLDLPNTGPLAKFAPTLGALILLQSNHTLMHGGQITVVRRKLGKPVMM